MPENQLIPENYESILGLRETEKRIKLVKDSFEQGLSRELNLQRVSAPLFVQSGTGINDDLNDVEKKVCFQAEKYPDINAEIVNSLAKWKRMKLKDYEFEIGEGLYTDMNAIRPDEEVLDNLHSIYVDQWDWEKAIDKKDRNINFLENTVREIYSVMKNTEEIVNLYHPKIKPALPDEITFVHTEKLLQRYHDLTPKKREDMVAERYGAVFLMGIGGELSDGTIHDGRAPDYDDWSTSTEYNRKGLNGDIIVWNDVLGRAFEISSMGIRVDKEAMLKQLKIRDVEERKDLEWHKRLLNGEFPESIGGGIGQSRLCMYFLKKAHIGEVQSSVWPDSVKDYCKDNGVYLL